jgi:hypothetical protein
MDTIKKKRTREQFFFSLCLDTTAGANQHVSFFAFFPHWCEESKEEEKKRTGGTASRYIFQKEKNRSCIQRQV